MCEVGSNQTMSDEKMPPRNYRILRYRRPPEESPACVFFTSIKIMFSISQLRALCLRTLTRCNSRKIKSGTAVLML